MRILVAGAGIAGLATATLLRRQGHEVVVVERRPDVRDDGYGLALWPHATRVTHALGIHDDVVAHSEPMAGYTALDRQGRVLTSSPMPEVIGEYGSLGVISRGDLLALLRRAAGVEPRYDAGVTALVQGEDSVVAELTDGSTVTADAAVGADGIGSAVRRSLQGPVPFHDTGWGCLVWWADGLGTDRPGETVERWGAGTFVGTYPCPDRVCVIAGARSSDLEGPGRAERARAVLRAHGLTDETWTSPLAGLADDDLPLWRMADVRAPHWTSGRVGLVGDAAAAFLPTAGVGASMALESAAALADELSRTDRHHVHQALALYERRRRRRTERAQTLSRRLARFMFVGSPWAATLRDAALARAGIETAVRPLVRDLRRPI